MSLGGFLGLEDEEPDYADWNFRSFWNGKGKELCYFAAIHAPYHISSRPIEESYSSSET